MPFQLYQLPSSFKFFRSGILDKNRIPKPNKSLPSECIRRVHDANRVSQLNFLSDPRRLDVRVSFDIVERALGGLRSSDSVNITHYPTISTEHVTSLGFCNHVEILTSEPSRNRSEGMICVLEQVEKVLAGDIHLPKLFSNTDAS
jgi:hypothetical protein